MDKHPRLPAVAARRRAFPADPGATEAAAAGAGVSTHAGQVPGRRWPGHSFTAGQPPPIRPSAWPASLSAWPASPIRLAGLAIRLAGLAHPPGQPPPIRSNM